MSYRVKQVVVVRKDLNMRKGKMCAQVSHASMGFLTDANYSDHPSKLHVHLTPAEQEWFADGTAKIVVGCDSLDELEGLVLRGETMGITVYKVTDRGHTEFHGEPTVTCAAFGPNSSEELDKLTSHLKLL